MRYLPFLLLFTLKGLSQSSLIHARHTSTYTYVYKLSMGEAETLYSSKLEELEDHYLQHLQDSFLTDKPDLSRIPEGNYLFLWTYENKLHFELKEIGNLELYPINNNHRILLELKRRDGTPVTDALVRMKRKKIPFNSELQAYELGRCNQKAYLGIESDGVYYHRSVDVPRKGGRYYYSRIKWIRQSPLKYLIQPARKIAWPVQEWVNLHWLGRYDFYERNLPRESKYAGYMTSNKPKYKPGDTVKLKAFLYNRYKNPINAPLLLRLFSESGDVDTVLTQLNPYRPGGYEYSFVLTKDLAGRLDEELRVSLEQKGSLRFDQAHYDRYNGDLDEGGYYARRKVVKRIQFGFEEYELGSIQFKARAENDSHHRGNNAILFFKATDENGMAVLDGRVQVVVKPQQQSLQTNEAQLFVPDTMWTYSLPLEAIGETKLVLPDSIFPKASFNYEVICNFLNSNNELKTERLYHRFDNNAYQLLVKEANDSLWIKQEEGKQNIEIAAQVTFYTGRSDSIGSINTLLPVKLRLYPNVSRYRIKTDYGELDYLPKRNSSRLSAQAQRTADSVFIVVNNPANYFFHYSIFAGQQLIKRGYAQELNYFNKATTQQPYYLSLQYISAGQVLNEDYTLSYQKNALDINVKQPEVVYPGQQVDVELTVTKKDGSPAIDADVTAYAHTAKFVESRIPSIPYFGKYYQPRKKQTLSSININAPVFQDSIGLYNWIRWSRELGLDTMAYYQFTHPETISKVEEPTRDSSTQFAPFALLLGDIQSIKQLYLDEVPIYFNQARHLKRYSFSVSPGKHSLRFRTRNAMIQIDSLWMTAGQKNFFSINLDTNVHKQLKYTKMPDTLTAYEAGYWNKYMLLVENNYGEKLAYLRQNSSLYPLTEALKKQRGYYYNNQSILTGPFPYNFSEFLVKDKYTRSFDPEGGYSYLLTKDLVRQKQLLPGTYPFSTKLNWDDTEIEKNFGDFVMTEKELDSLWQDYLDRRNASEDLFRNPSLSSKGNGELSISFGEALQSDNIFPKNHLVFRMDDADFLRVYSGSSKELGYFSPGLYRIYVLFNANRYVLIDSIEVKPNGKNRYFFSQLSLKAVDSISEKMMQIVNNRTSLRNYDRYYNNNSDRDMLELKTSFNDKYLVSSQLTRTVSGVVKDREKGQPLSGVTVLLKGTRVGTVTDPNGRFSLNVSPQGSLVCSYVGYENMETRLGESDYLEIRMGVMNMNLEEVVVVGYGSKAKRELTASVSVVGDGRALMAIQGKVPGIQIRGSNTINANNPPLMIVDGLPYTGPSLSPDSIGEINILKDEAAVSLYGSRAANGVIVITTKKKATAALQELADLPPVGSQSLRQHFRDDALWKPRLRTNENGKVSYRFTYPDDITNWKQYFIAMGPGKFSGSNEMSVRSFKQISANISTPTFLVEGDRSQLIAKALNYSLDTIRVKTGFSQDDLPAIKQELSLSNSHIDSFWVIASSTDSMRVSYTLQKSDGYSDGELRKIPVVKKGVKETTGFFAVLDRDTSFIIKPDTTQSDLKLYATASALPVLMDEVDKIRDYKYYCNEQLASKLKALLWKRRVLQMQQKEFKEKKSIHEIINRLLNAKNNESLWGWWPGNDYQPWISLHVAEALLMAKTDSFSVNWNTAPLVDEIVYRLEKQTPADQIQSLQLLHQMNAKVDFGKYVDSLSNKKWVTHYDQWRLMYLKQQLGRSVTLDSLLKYKQQSLFNNIYWGTDRYLFFDNSIQETLLAYKILKKAGGYENELKKIRYWFLEQRNSGQWRNTYESSLILETLLPDLMKDQAMGKPELYLNGRRIESYPIEMKAENKQSISVQSKGAQPVYFTAYQQAWNPNPVAVKGSFEVSTILEQENKEVKTLKAGLPVLLKVKVNVLADAEYVMVEVPIPAGCSYKDKPKGYGYGEVYREYYKEKVNIFCSKLTKGTAEFVIPLLPRFSGMYHLNPALVEQMYFPVFYGREGMKDIFIR